MTARSYPDAQSAGHTEVRPTLAAVPRDDGHDPRMNTESSTPSAGPATNTRVQRNFRASYGPLMYTPVITPRTARIVAKMAIYGRADLDPAFVEAWMRYSNTAEQLDAMDDLHFQREVVASMAFAYGQSLAERIEMAAERGLVVRDDTQNAPREEVDQTPNTSRIPSTAHGLQRALMSLDIGAVPTNAGPRRWREEDK